MPADALRGFRTIVANEGTAEAVLGAVGAGSMNGTAIEEEGVARFHLAGNGLFSFWGGDEVRGEGFGVVDRSPRGYAGLRFHQKIEIVLVHRLTARARWLVVKHALRCEDILLHEFPQAGKNTRMDEILSR